MAGCASPTAASSLADRMRQALPPTILATDSGSADSQTAAALQAVVQKANDEQVQAFAQGDPTVMKDTSTASYYQQLTQINGDMSSNGVSGINLVKMEFGPATVNGSRAQLTTYETWSTTYADGSTDQSRDRNVYTLVNQNGSWAIQADTHPDTAVEQPVPATPGTQPAPGSRVQPGQGQSRNWSGYEATGGSFTSVSGTWTVPQTDGSSVGADASWVGIGGVQSRDLIQAGTETDASGNGRVHYQAWIEMLPQASHPVPLTVNPGDSVSVSIAEQGTDQWLITLKNNTTGKNYQATEQYTSSNSSAEWVEEAPSGGRRVLPLDNFGKVDFSAGVATKDGQSFSVSRTGNLTTTGPATDGTVPPIVQIIPGNGRRPGGRGTRGGAPGTIVDPLTGFGFGRSGR